MKKIIRIGLLFLFVAAFSAGKVKAGESIPTNTGTHSINAETRSLTTPDVIDNDRQNAPLTHFTITGKITGADEELLLKEAGSTDGIKIAITEYEPLQNLSQIFTLSNILGVAEVDPESLTYTFSDVPEGEYYIFGAYFDEEKNKFIAFYMYNTDDNLFTDEKITLNNETAAGGTLADIDLTRWQITLIDYKQSLPNANTLIEHLDQNAVYYNSEADYTYNTSQPNDIPDEIDGLFPGWAHAYANVDDDTAYVAISLEAGAYLMLPLEPYDKNIFKVITPAPANALNSTDVAAIAEANGGKAFREKNHATEDLFIKITFTLLHSFWEVTDNGPDGIPVFWTVKYEAYTYEVNEQEQVEKVPVDFHRVVIDAVTGEVWEPEPPTTIRKENAGLPVTAELQQNYPNPFNPATNITFAILKAADVTLEVFDLLGQKVATLVNSRYSAGRHTVTFNAENLSSGFYFYRIQTGDFVSTRKLMLLK